MKEAYGYTLIVAASIIWGTMGVFGTVAFGYGIDPVTLTTLRILISSSTMLIPIALFKRELLKVERKDLPLLLIFGILAVAFQRIAYFFTVDFTTPTTAAVLFYTYPAFVTIYAAVFLREKITFTTVFAIILAFLGSVLVVRAYESSWLSLGLSGFVFGILTSVLFALYFVLTKKLRNRYTNWTLLLYGDGIGAIALAPVLFLSFPKMAFYSQQLWVLILVIAWFPSLIAYLLFSHALKYVESSKGSVLSVMEPLSASLFSSMFLGERFETLQILGVVLALGGIVLLFYQQKTNRTTRLNIET